MNIVYIIGNLSSPGGAESVLVNKANYLADVFGHEIHILIALQQKKPIYYNLSNKIKVHSLEISQYNLSSAIPVLSFFSNIQKLKKVYENKLIEIDPNIILVLERGYADFIIPNILPNIPKIRESHSSWEAVQIMNKGTKGLFKELKDRYFTYLYKKQMMKYNHVVLLTERDRKKRKYLKKTSVIPNTIIPNTQGQAKLENKKVISVGRLDEFKNHKDQILIWQHIIKKHPDWTLHIYGVGFEKDNLNNLISNLNLNKHVFLEGISTQLDKAYNQSSIFLFTSLAEGFGLVIAEAMQAGLPVIAYDSPCGPAEIISDNKDGFLVKTCDLKNMEKKLIALIENKELRAKMGKNAHVNSKYYLQENIMKKWDVFFNKIIDE